VGAGSLIPEQAREFEFLTKLFLLIGRLHKRIGEIVHVPISGNGHLLRRGNPFFDDVTIDPYNLDMDLITDDNALINFSR
jgi:hypothetical protein